MDLNGSNYFSVEANREYWSVSQFKAFNKCEAAGLAEVRGEYTREMTDSLLIGKYVDAWFSDELPQFMGEYGELITKKDGTLKAQFLHANDMISVVESDPMMMKYLEGSKQTILTADFFGVPWKGKLDILNDKRIVDFKTVKDFEDIWDPVYGRRSWIEFWGYDIQGAIYQRLVFQITDKLLPFYIEAVTKEKVPDHAIIEIPQHILNAASAMVEAKIERFDLIKSGEVEPIRCEHCDYCKKTKLIKAPTVYEIEEAKE